MKYLIVLGLLIFPLVSKAQLAGFLDGNMYDLSTGTWQCQFLMDGNCYSLDQKILMIRSTTPNVTTSIPVSTPDTVYVPVYVSPIGGGGEPSVPIIPPSVAPVVSFPNNSQSTGNGSIISNVPIVIKSFQYTLKNKGNAKRLQVWTNDGDSRGYVYNGVLPLDYNQTGEYTFQTPYIFDSLKNDLGDGPYYGGSIVNFFDEAVADNSPEISDGHYYFFISQVTYQVKGDDTDRIINVSLP